MRCNRVVPNLKAYLDGETSHFQTAYIRRHLRQCPACATQFAEWQNLNALLLANDLVFAPGIENPCLSGLRPSVRRTQIHVLRRGHPRMSLKLLTGLVATSATVLALVMLPGKGRHNTSMAAEIRRAVSGVNTWHLKGWKLQNGKPIAWEVWGRRAPFFYREQVGQDVIVDNGTGRVSLFAPLKRNGGPLSPGIALKTPSTPDASNTRWSYTQMVAQWNNMQMRPLAQTAKDVTFNFPESGFFIGGEDGTMTDLLYTIRKETWLPTHYETRLGKPNAKKTLALLNADYNAPIPSTVAQLPLLPKDYKVYDATQPAPTGKNTVTQNGITVQATPLLLTSDGMVLLRVKTWMGGALIDRYGPLTIGLNAERWKPDKMIIPANTDDLKRAYTQVQWEGIQDSNQDPSSMLLLLATSDPLVRDAQAATNLTLRLDVSTHMDTRLSGTTGMGDQQLARQTMPLTVALPAPATPAARSLAAYIDPHWKRHTRNFEGYENLPAAVDMARSLFYGDLLDFRNPDRPHLLKSVAYREKFFVDTSCPGVAALHHYMTAQIYVALGNKTRARQLLQEVIDDKRLDAHLQPAGNPVLAEMPIALRKKIQAEAVQNLNRERQSAREALNTWAK